MKSTCKSLIVLACATVTLGTQAQTAPSAAPAGPTSAAPAPTPAPARKLGSKALGTMDPRTTNAIESIGRTNANIAAMAAGAGAAVGPQSGATEMQGSVSTPSMLAIGLAGLAALGGGGGGGGGGSTGTTR